MRFMPFIIALILCLTGITNPGHSSAAEKELLQPDHQCGCR
jgi:hypothetical protein